MSISCSFMSTDSQWFFVVGKFFIWIFSKKKSNKLIKVLVRWGESRKEMERKATKPKKTSYTDTHTVWMRSPVCTSVISIHLSAHDHYNCFFSLFVHSPCCIVCWLAAFSCVARTHTACDCTPVCACA